MEDLFKESDMLKRNEEDVMFSEVDGESVIMHLQSGRYFGLNSVTTDIWNHLENGLNFTQLVDLLLAEYDVKKEQCVEETKNVIDAFLKMKFVTIEE